MCGICGFTGPPARSVLEAMTNTIVHRGPDDVGLWDDDPRVSLGMRRLSIVDLASGQQPVANEDERVWVVFNGEIYNHPELRAELEAQGHRFRTDHSDTEVLVHLYEEHGPDYVNKLNGMFAIALWDARYGELHLARDRAGIKPLYWASAAGRYVFASEIKSLLAHPSVVRQPNWQALHHYFSFKNVPAPLSAFDGIYQLRPGERAVIKGDAIHCQRWWRLRFDESPSMTEADAAAHIRELLTDSVRLRMRADVPFGAYLSGGVDSSSVVALMACLGARRVKTFSLIYEDDFKGKLTDREFAAQVSRQYGTDHYEYVMTHEDLLESIESVTCAFDEPFSGVTSTFFLTRLISKHVKVALSGDGADELFASYLPHRLARPLAVYPRLRDHVDRLMDSEKSELAPYEASTDTLEELLQRGDEASRRMAQLLWDDQTKASLYSEKMLRLVGNCRTEDLIRELYAQSRTADPLNRALFVDFETLLPDQVLAFVDRLSMSHSVEVRPPFLDYRLMEFAATVPGNMKIKAGRVKHVLKEAVRGLIPDAILDRPKEGFVLPVNDWLGQQLRPYVCGVLSPERLRRHGLFSEESVGRLLEEHRTGVGQHASRLWNLMMFQVWWERYFG
jgi:asparagine synthase (glutamine-hydrolysing)